MTELDKIIKNNMKLFLASESKYPETIKKLEQYVGGFENKKIAYIPTAANGEYSYGSWEKNSETWKLVNNLDAEVTPVVLEEQNDQEIKNNLTGKDIIWFPGGACGYLMYWLRRRGVDRYLKNILKQGVIYVGSSAGSMITSKGPNIVEWHIGDTEAGAGIIPGLGLVDFDIFPHYEDNLFNQIKEIYKGDKLYLLKNGEEIIWDNGKVSVNGKERIIL